MPKLAENSSQMQQKTLAGTARLTVAFSKQ
jgi:hypothetical protein